MLKILFIIAAIGVIITLISDSDSIIVKSSAGMIVIAAAMGLIGLITSMDIFYTIAKGALVILILIIVGGVLVKLFGD